MAREWFGYANIDATLADLYDALGLLTDVVAKRGSKKRPKAPKPYRRPGSTRVLKPRSVAEMRNPFK